MIIECEICGSWAEMDKPPLNNICPVCCSIGSLFILPTNGENKKDEKGKIHDNK